jgi:hypothetical protein
MLTLMLWTLLGARAYLLISHMVALVKLLACQEPECPGLPSEIPLKVKAAAGVLKGSLWTLNSEMREVMEIWL